MAKQLAKADTGNELAVGPAVLATAPLMEGEDAALSLSRLAMYAGTAEEEKKYPDSGLRRGDFFDTLDARKIGTVAKIVVVSGWRSWVKFDSQGKLIYSHKNRADVPPADLIQFDEQNQKIMDAAIECINTVIVVEGERWPYLYVWKRTALKAWTLIEKIEARRSMTGQGRGMYELGSVDDKNQAGQSFKRLVSKSLGNPTPELANLAAKVHAAMPTIKKDAEAKVEESLKGDGVADGVKAAVYNEAPAPATDEDIPF